MNSVKNSHYGKFIKDLVVFQTDPDHGSKAVYNVARCMQVHGIPEPEGILKLFKDAIAEHDKRFAVIHENLHNCITAI